LHWLQYQVGKTDFKDIAPRVGFAYTPPWLNGKTVVRGGAGILYGPLQYDDFGGSMNSGYKSNPSFNSNNGFDPSFVIDAGYPAFPAPPNLDPGQFNGQPVSGSYIETKAGRPAEVYDYNLQVQQEVAKDLILSIGYVGSEAQNLQANNQNLNNIPYQDIALGNLLGTNVANNPYGVAAPFTGFTVYGEITCRFSAPSVLFRSMTTLTPVAACRQRVTPATTLCWCRCHAASAMG
jgi:hypothetical protein